MVHGILGLCSVDLLSLPPRLYIYIEREIFRSRDIPTYLYPRPSRKRFYEKKRNEKRGRKNRKIKPLFNASNNIGKITFKR